MSRNHGRTAIGTAESCEYYADSRIGASESKGSTDKLGGSSPVGTTCVDCHYWMPFEMMSRVGQCDNPSSRFFGRPAFSDKPTEECFTPRSLDGLEFMWCQSHRQTIYSAELPDHAGCRIFESSVSLPVEDQMELTLAGD